MAEPRVREFVYASADAERAVAAMGELAVELHTMSQPITALLCSLEIGSMTGTMEGYKAAVQESLVQCDRLMKSIGTMRATIARTVERP